MGKHNKEDVEKFVDEFIEKNPWIMSRLWDDGCSCKTEDIILDTCERHGTNKLGKWKKLG